MLITRFDNIQFLASGTSRQQLASQLLSTHRLMDLLGEFDPILAGTIPINIDIDNSDLDIICSFADKAHFSQKITGLFSGFEGFTLTDDVIDQQETILANFFVDGWPVEVFGQHVPTRHQNAYRHMVVEYLLLEHHGESFRQEVVRLKKQGYKTEPAFAHLLNLAGDPYQVLLDPGLMDLFKNK